MRANISVVVPCFRCAETIDRAIGSVLSQTLLPCELILIDDASNDETMLILQNWRARYPDWIKIVALNKNSGPGVARNAGWELAAGEYIAFLDADDFWHSQKIKIQYEYMQSNPDITLSGHTHCIEGIDCVDVFYADEDINKYPSNDLSLWSVLIKNPFVTPSVMVRASIFHRFEIDGRHMEDHLLWMKIALAHQKMAMIKIPLVKLYKEQFGVSGLSADFKSMAMSDFGNYFLLWKRDLISLFQMMALWGVCFVKTLRRIILLGYRKIFKIHMK